MALKKTYSGAVLLVVATAVLLLSPPTEGSYMTVWGSPGCQGAAQRYSSCGCSNINLNAGYEFGYQGQTAAVYNQPGCQGVAHTQFRGSVRNCGGIGWQSGRASSSSADLIINYITSTLHACMLDNAVVPSVFRVFRR